MLLNRQIRLSAKEPKMPITAEQTPKTILRIDASMRRTGSSSRLLSDELIAKLSAEESHRIINRDLADGIPLINENWINANFTPEEDRTAEQLETLALSDALVGELMESDTLVIGLPIYNFGVPAALKAWIDLVCRARLTFKYTENGPVGLLEGRKAYIVVASGGTAAGSEIDYAARYMQHVLGFIGIHDVEVIDASGQMIDTDAALSRAREHISRQESVLAAVA